MVIGCNAGWEMCWAHVAACRGCGGGGALSCKEPGLVVDGTGPAAVVVVDRGPLKDGSLAF